MKIEFDVNKMENIGDLYLEAINELAPTEVTEFLLAKYTEMANERIALMAMEKMTNER